MPESKSPGLAMRLALLVASFPFLYYGGTRGVAWCAAFGSAIALYVAAGCILRP